MGVDATDRQEEVGGDQKHIAYNNIIVFAGHRLEWEGKDQFSLMCGFIQGETRERMAFHSKSGWRIFQMLCRTRRAASQQ